MTPPNRRVLALIAILGGSGVIHFVKPSFYEDIVPPQLGDARTLVLASGAAELVCAGLLAAPRTRKLGALASIGVLVGVFPANVYTVKVVGPSRLRQAGALARLPLQWPMLRLALRIFRTG
jgi:uncharacterized membrane protein